MEVDVHAKMGRIDRRNDSMLKAIELIYRRLLNSKYICTGVKRVQML